MANVSLDSLIFTPVVADLEARSRDFWAQNCNLSTAFSGGPKTLQHDSQHSATGASRDDAFLISSDDESDYGHQSDISFPSIWELPLLARRGDGQSSSIAGDQSLRCIRC
jgi:hypothetical protein